MPENVLFLQMVGQTMNALDLSDFIARNGVVAEIVTLPMETPTVAAAAAALGIRAEQIIKSVLFIAGAQPVLVITNGLTRIHRRRLADELGLSRRQVKIATSDQVQEITGYPVGAVPPFGHATRLPALLDTGVLEEEEVYGGGGEINALMRVTTAELQRVLGGRVVHIADR